MPNRGVLIALYLTQLKGVSDGAEESNRAVICVKNHIYCSTPYLIGHNPHRRQICTELTTFDGGKTVQVSVDDEHDTVMFS